MTAWSIGSKEKREEEEFVRILAERAGQKEERHSSRYHEPLKQHIAIALGPLPHCTTPPRFAGP